MIQEAVLFFINIYLTGVTCGVAMCCSHSPTTPFALMQASSPCYHYVSIKLAGLLLEIIQTFVSLHLHLPLLLHLSLLTSYHHSLAVEAAVY